MGNSLSSPLPSSTSISSTYFSCDQVVDSSKNDNEKNQPPVSGPELENTINPNTFDKKLSLFNKFELSCEGASLEDYYYRLIFSKVDTYSSPSNNDHKLKMKFFSGNFNFYLFFYLIYNY